jgi:hypothetical protein
MGHTTKTQNFDQLKFQRSFLLLWKNTFDHQVEFNLMSFHYQYLITYKIIMIIMTINICFAVN